MPTISDSTNPTDSYRVIVQGARWLLAATVIVIFLYAIGRIIGWIPSISNICEYNQYTNKEHCTYYDTTEVILRQTAAFLNYNSGVLSALATIFIAFFTYTLWKTSSDQHERLRETIDQADRHFQADKRPWVSIMPRIRDGVSFSVNGATFSFDFTLKNTGNSPATGVFVTIEVYPSLVYTDEVPRQHAMSDKIKRNPLEQGITIFPGQEITLPIGTMVSQEEIDKFQTSLVPTGEKIPFFYPVLIGCVTYKSIFERDPHQTGFIFRIQQRHPKGGWVGVFTDKGDIAPHDLGLVRWMEEGRTD